MRYECRAPHFGNIWDKKRAGTIHVQSLLGGAGGVTKCGIDARVQKFLDQLSDESGEKK